LKFSASSIQSKPCTFGFLFGPLKGPLGGHQFADDDDDDDEVKEAVHDCLHTRHKELFSDVIRKQTGRQNMVRCKETVWKSKAPVTFTTEFNYEGVGKHGNFLITFVLIH
jgi:hypothetical protein